MVLDVPSDAVWSVGVLQSVTLTVKNISGQPIELSGVGVVVNGYLAAPQSQWYGAMAEGETIEHVIDYTPYSEGDFTLTPWATRNSPFEYAEGAGYTGAVIGGGSNNGGGW